MAEIRREGILSRETAQAKGWSWNEHSLDAELSGTPVGERSHYLRINTDGAGGLWTSRCGQLRVLEVLEPEVINESML